MPRRGERNPLRAARRPRLNSRLPLPRLSVKWVQLLSPRHGLGLGAGRDVRGKHTIGVVPFPYGEYRLMEIRGTLPGMLRALWKPSQTLLKL